MYTAIDQCSSEHLFFVSIAWAKQLIGSTPESEILKTLECVEGLDLGN